MENVFLEVADGLDTNESSLWIPAAKILSFIVATRPDNGTARLCVEAERIRNVRSYPATPWLNSVEEAESARRQVIQLLEDALPTQVVRWKGSALVCEAR